ncbi:bacterial regulatory helix-turn-helix, lysR family protein [Paraburkholderia xenovorans LB400]|jgi:LysR family transcriptional regulator, glycine cleavage system transcriptional activator|uniref:Transcriptional regulator, LysR family n=2 Tax=Paraburkholderia TaxID=1822464 RepID=Q13Q04_PARXL|nr:MULTISPECIES: transcriptional regulator GcvA [Paraburkholderia]EIF33406.1 transcriptional regulator [Burkholderia sp. Ch1-1]ABE33835.1 transcriptional regulator, LysR family [Paraburkholderia xenovorans LB400]AIP37809.1 bacterial regulatory helix-turn-helix, lysR family protein [Paraburkholderia xenovorans LB400]MDR8395821.1 transcriptional regulator GcvA [Paraburkholderia sp. USG1]NPT38733.1 transcriptional regulator GcvA [Paraburkholderia xenovorans]
MPKRRLPSLNALRAFESAARNQSMTRAAEELCVTHSAISRHVAKLEDYLNAKLFERGHQQVVLTKRGAAYASRLQVLFDQIQDVTAEYFYARPDNASLRIGVLSTFAMRFLIPRLARFKKLYPEITLQVESAHEHVSPRDEEVDVAIWFGNGDWPGLVSEHLFHEELVPVGSPTLLAGHELGNPDDLESFLLLHAAARHDDWQRWLSATGATRVDGYKGLKLEYSGLAYQGAVDGLGLAMAQTLFVQEDLANRRLVAALPQRVKTGRSYYLVHNEMKSEQPVILRFSEWLKDEVRKTIEEIDRTQAEHIEVV